MSGFEKRMDATDEDDETSFNEDDALVSGAFAKQTRIHLIWLLVSNYVRLLQRTVRLERGSQILRHLPKATIKVARDFLPSPLMESTAPTQLNPNRKNINTVAAIDGLRGFACLIVFHGHLSHNFSMPFFIEGNWRGRVYLAQYPFIRVIWSSTSMVRVFWVVGGYTLALKPLKLLRARDYAGFQKTWSSSLVRRGFRLYLPPIAAVFIIGFLNWFGLFAAARASAKRDGPDLHLPETLLDPQANLIAQMSDAFHASMKMFKIWEWDTKVHPGHYNDHYWNVPVQYRTAIFMFVVLLAGSRMKSFYRTILLGSISLLGLFVWERPEITTFFGGMFLADLDARRSSPTTSLPSHHDNLPKLSSPRLLPRPGGRLGFISCRLNALFQLQSIYLLIFILGWLFCCTSAWHIEKQPLIGSVVTTFPFLGRDNGQPLRCIGAILLTYGVVHCTYVQLLFTSRVASYLGKLSYSLYLMHGVVLRAVLYPLMPHIFHAVGCDGPADSDPKCSEIDFVVSYLMALSVCLPLVLWAADIFWRKVEAPLARLSMSLERILAPPAT